MKPADYSPTEQCRHWTEMNGDQSSNEHVVVQQRLTNNRWWGTRLWRGWFTDTCTDIYAQWLWELWVTEKLFNSHAHHLSQWTDLGISAMWQNLEALTTEIKTALNAYYCEGSILIKIHSWKCLKETVGSEPGRKHGSHEVLLEQKDKTVWFKLWKNFQFQF